MIIPNGIDIAHFNSVNFSAIGSAGIVIVIHKAKQGIGVKDSKYTSRMNAAKEASFLWGAYDFATSDNPAADAAAFLAFANLGPEDLPILDFEDNTHFEMSGDHAYIWLDTVAQKLGRPAALYGGNRPREQIDHQAAKWVDMAKVVQLWQCRYIKSHPEDNETLFRAIPPIPPWTSNFGIQFTGDGIGPLPHTVSGVENGADLDVFMPGATKEQLAAAWAKGGASA